MNKSRKPMTRGDKIILAIFLSIALPAIVYVMFWPSQSNFNNPDHPENDVIYHAH